MFVIGLELQPSRLWVLRRSIFGLGAAQVGVTSICIGAAAYLLYGQPWQSSLIIGFGLSMSSTALALQLLAERGQLNSQFGRSAFSILLFQDVSVLPALALLPLLGLASAKAAGVLIVLGTALLLSQVGLSLSLGAFWPEFCWPTANFATNSKRT